MTEEHKRKIGEANRGKKKGPMSDSTKKKISDALFGIKRPFKRHKPHSQEARTKMSLSAIARYDRIGRKTPIILALRMSREYKDWRTKVFERDGYKCVQCMATGELNADHIKPFAKYAELRFDLENGRTLCVPCHKLTPTFARNTK